MWPRGWVVFGREEEVDLCQERESLAIDDVDDDAAVGGWVVLFIVNHLATPRGGGGGEY